MSPLKTFVSPALVLTCRWSICCRRSVKLYHAFADASHRYLVLEHVIGDGLHELACGTILRPRHGIRLSLAAFYSAEVLAALQYLHEHGVVYRDLKVARL